MNILRDTILVFCAAVGLIMIYGTIMQPIWFKKMLIQLLLQ